MMKYPVLPHQTTNIVHTFAFFVRRYSHTLREAYVMRLFFYLIDLLLKVTMFICRYNIFVQFQINIIQTLLRTSVQCFTALYIYLLESSV